MADGEEGEAMAEGKRRRGEITADVGGAKKLRASAELFDEPLASRPSEIKHQRNGVSSREEEIATAEVVNTSRSGSASAVEDFGDGEGGLCSDVDEEFLDETDSEDAAEDDDDEEGDYTDEEESDVELQLASSQNPPRRIEKGIVLDKGKGKAVAPQAPSHDYKGKGKAIVQEEDSSDDSEVGVEDDEIYKANMALLGDGDPLEEVDLNNILPTRTRRRTIQQPVQCVDDPGNGSSDDDEDYVAGGDYDTPGN